LFSAPLLFYCHFPDQLLTERKSLFKKLYRIFIDSLEGWTTAMADIICVNSEFTREVVRRTFPGLAAHHLHVLYPTINVQFFDSSTTASLKELPQTARHIFLSINRFERKKNIALALQAFGLLDNLADEEKLELLRCATAVLYTPSNEHFGIVPVEAMYMRCCVIAPNNGGPRESIIDGETGFLVNADADSFAEKMSVLVTDKHRARAMGDAGRERVLSIFTMESFAKKLESLMHTVITKSVSS
uniref:Alpha-1,3/1,6-mannosyltransferase ALG2 n=1 Tax=Gongylonema pulchrum TaxID=637853 RepID=A0A183E082_9BILA